MIFEDNTEFIIPFVIKNKLAIDFYFYRSYMQKLGSVLFLVIETNNKHVSEAYLLKTEPNFYNIYRKDKIVIKFIIPEHLSFLCNIIQKIGYKGVDKDFLYDCICYWGKNSSKVLRNEKTQAARESSLGLIFYFSSCIIWFS